MKTYIIAFFTVGMFLFAGMPGMRAQSTPDSNQRAQPAWGPAGYDRADYYYLPDVECYYSVLNHQFIYLSNGRWVFMAGLPPAFAKYDLYSGYKVVINKARPYLDFDKDRISYQQYKGRKNEQPPIKPMTVTPLSPVKLPQVVPPKVIPKVVPKIPIAPPVTPPVIRPHIF